MFKIENISSEWYQKHRISNASLPEGCELTLLYSAAQYGWFFDISYGRFTLKGSRLAVSPNLLRQFRYVTTLGLAAVTEDGQEILFDSDFESGRASLYLLDEADIDRVEIYFFN
jgi:hypothetical protein